MNPLFKFMLAHPKLVQQLRTLKNGRRPVNFSKPRTLLEYIKCQCVNYDSRWPLLADKYRVREKVAQLIGEQYLNELLGVYHSASEIDINTLPQRFVLKVNNGCGANLIVKDKSTLNWGGVKRQLDKWLAFPYGAVTGQPHYMQTEPCIIAEAFLESKGKSSPTDYKFFCVNGQILFVVICENRQQNSHAYDMNLVDTDFNPMPQYLSDMFPHTTNLQKPASFDKMKQLVTKLAQGHEFVRIDFYDIDGRPIFGEYTFTPGLEPLSEKCRAYIFKLLDKT